MNDLYYMDGSPDYFTALRSLGFVDGIGCSRYVDIVYGRFVAEETSYVDEEQGIQMICKV